MDCYSATVAEIDLGAIAGNVRNIVAKVAPAQVIAVVKANGYGHGALRVAETAMANGAQMLAVANLDEGRELRSAGVTAPILVMQTFFPEHAPAFLDDELEATVFDMERARSLSRAAMTVNGEVSVHVKVDTGMGRQGVAWRQAADLIGQIYKLPGLSLKGLFTHFAASDAHDKAYTGKQVQRFEQVVADLKMAGINVPLKHTANSGAILDCPETYFDAVRAGVSMYGYYPSQETSESLALRPGMTLKSRVLAVQQLEAEEFVSYGMTYQTKVSTGIAVVPIGYGDGWNRMLSNRVEVLIGGKRYPSVGRVCMDAIMVDVGPKSEVEVGDDVVLMGKQGGAEISIYELCAKLETIPYEITCWVSQRVPRAYKA